MKYEYKIDRFEWKVDYDSDVDAQRAALNDWMNEHGAEGWELVHYSPFNLSYVQGAYCVWKRVVS